MSDLTVPASLQLLDVVGNGHDCERYLWIRALSDPSTPRKERIDLIDDVRHYPGELRHFASVDGTLAGTSYALSEPSGDGACYLTVFSRSDPGEPLLGDVIEFVSMHARRHAIDRIECGDSAGAAHMVALRERHGFVEHEVWRRFHLDVRGADEHHVAIPDGMSLTTLKQRPDLADQAHDAFLAGMVDTNGSFPRVDTPLDAWLTDIDSSLVRGRDQILLLLDDATGSVAGMVQLDLVSTGSQHAWLEFLTVARSHRGAGLSVLLKQAATAHAVALGITRLQTINHAENDAIVRLNERLGWVEDPPRVALQRPVQPKRDSR